jgi:hypothetical protein
MSGTRLILVSRIMLLILRPLATCGTKGYQGQSPWLVRYSPRSFLMELMSLRVRRLSFAAQILDEVS